MAPTVEQVVAAVEASTVHRGLRVTPGVPPVPSDAYAIAASGEIATGLVEVPGVAARKAYGVGVIDVDIATLWAAINDETRHPGYTAMGYSELLSGEPCQSGRHVLQFLPIAMVSDRWWITIISANDAISRASGGSVREAWWTSSTDPAEIKSAAGQAQIANGIPIGFTKGGWLLISIDAAHTLVEYYVWSDPGGNVPSGAMSWFAAGSLTDAIRAMSAYAHDGKSQCPRG